MDNNAINLTFYYPSCPREKYGKGTILRFSRRNAAIFYDRYKNLNHQDFDPEVWSNDDPCGSKFELFVSKNGKPKEKELKIKDLTSLKIAQSKYISFNERFEIPQFSS